MNKLYLSLIEIITLNEAAMRDGKSEIKTPSLPSLGEAGSALLDLMVQLQELSDLADVWILHTDLPKDDWVGRKDIGGHVLHIYIQAVENSKRSTLDEGYDKVEEAFLEELHHWLCGQLGLDEERKASDEQGYEYLQEQLVKNLVKAHRTNWNSWNMEALSAQWAMERTSEWLKLDNNYKAYGAVTCSRGFLLNIGNQKLRLVYLTECANSPADRLCTNDFDLTKAMSVGNTVTVKTPANARDVYDHFHKA